VAPIASGRCILRASASVFRREIRRDMSANPAQPAAAAEPPPGTDFDYEAALAACARGDAAALQALYERESPRLLGMATRVLRRRDLAEDAVHDAFVQIWQKSSSFRPERGSARGWIYTVVRHRAISVMRALDHDQPLDQAALDEMPDAATLSGGLAAQVDSAALARCLEELDLPKRTCIALAYVDGYSHAQIAARLHAPLGTVKAWIRRALQALRDCLE
jgi:RNA polymerase sigma-70 factor (ECF subfamily)